MDQPRRMGIRAFRLPAPYDRLVEEGSAAYDRRTLLPRLLPWPQGPSDADEDAESRRVCRLLARAARAERNRGRAGHWSYDLNRHIGLMQALKAERRRLVGAGRDALERSEGNGGGAVREGAAVRR